MNRELVPAEEYFRPRRARELQRQAQWRAWCSQRIRSPLAPLSAGLLGLWVALACVFGEQTSALLQVAFLFTGSVSGLFVAGSALRRGALARRTTAEALEAEHEAHYGTTGGGALKQRLCPDCGVDLVRIQLLPSSIAPDATVLRFVPFNEGRRLWKKRTRVPGTISPWHCPECGLVRLYTNTSRDISSMPAP